MDENTAVVMCCRCNKTTTMEDGFVINDHKWLCGECAVIEEALAINNREFATGATRDTNKSKLAYDRGLSVQVLQRYMEYLEKHRVQKDGSLRNFDNWKQGIPPAVYRESLMRHCVDTIRKSKGLPLREEMDLEDLLCADIFNSMGWLFELLVAKSGNRELES